MPDASCRWPAGPRGRGTRCACATWPSSWPRRTRGRTVAMPEAASLGERARAAIGDRFLQEALAGATGKFMTARRSALAGFPQGEAYRERARQIKEATLQRLGQDLGQLAGNVERAGGRGARGRAAAGG